MNATGLPGGSKGEVVGSRVAADKAAVLRVQVPPYQFVHFRYVAISQLLRVTAGALREVNGPAALCPAQR
jgi:hypothetical protein